VSHGSMRRLSGTSTRRGRSSHPPAPAKTSPHTKLNTLVSRGTDIGTFSPLAQVFNPFLHDDNREAQVFGSPPTTQGVSYGPASRRRFTSILSSQPRPAPETFSNGQSNHRSNRILSANETTSSPQYAIPPRSRSSDPSHSMRSPVSAQEMKDMDDDTSEMPEQATLMSRLDDIENRQMKIESLLVAISNSINGNQGHG
jgi:hypothetical protein